MVYGQGCRNRWTGLWCTVKGVETGGRVYAVKFEDQDSGFQVQGLGSRVQDLSYRDQVSGFRF
jgi:hypothetical protein